MRRKMSLELWKIYARSGDPQQVEAHNDQDKAADAIHPTLTTDPSHALAVPHPVPAARLQQPHQEQT